jgi:hypothetical protein
LSICKNNSMLDNPNLPRLKISPDGHHLVTAGGAPFFWLGDTAWELFHRLKHEEAERYFANRQAKRFTLIQIVVLAEFDGLNTPNIYGDRPLIDNEPLRPNPAYFQLVDEYIQLAAAHGLYIGLLPTWGDKVVPLWGLGPVIFNESNAYDYGQWLGERYQRQTNLIWILGGDRPAVHEIGDFRPLWRAMAAGISAGAPEALFSYHPSGGQQTSTWLNEEPWLHIHMLQSGHGSGRDVPVWEMISQDYHLQPARPCLDGEQNYEDHPVNPWPNWEPQNGYFRDHDVRKQAYRSVLAGACGVTYGHHAVWQFCCDQRPAINHADRDWISALDRPGAAQLKHLRALVESRPILSRIPDQTLLAGDPGSGGDHRRAARSADGGYAFIYLPRPLPVTVRTDNLSGDKLKAWWFDPCNGAADFIGSISRQFLPTFSPPGHRPDWVLVLDDASRGFDPPGQSAL